MSCLLEKFVNRVDFESYEDFVGNFQINIPENFNFAYDVVDYYAEQQPEKRALVWCDDLDNDKTLTFGEMKTLSDKAANFFLSRGIKKGDYVKLLLKGHYSFWYCFLGLHKIGAIATPGTHMLTTKDLVYRIEKADIKMIVCINEGSLADFVDEAQNKTGGILKDKVLLGDNREGWFNLENEIEKASPDFTRPTGTADTTNEDIFLAYFSSGTVGYPKMVQHVNTYPLGHIPTAKYWQNCQDDGLHYTVADTGWAKVVWGKIYGQWICGSAVFAYDYDKFDAANLARKCADFGVTTFCAPPTVYRFLIKEDLSQYDFSGLQYTVTAGEPLNPEIYEKFLEFTGMRIMEGFGQTETSVQIGTFLWMDTKPGSMGKPCPLYEIELMNAEGGFCEDGEEGEIVIRTDKGRPLSLFTGYHRDEDKTGEVWHDGFYHTGDMAWRDEDGYYWFVGRADDVIKSSGYRIGPFEVESALIEHPAVLECAITGVPDPIRGQVIKATVVLTKDYAASAELILELQNHVKSVTAPYKYPRVIEFVSELPKTISGKIRRVEIRDKDEADKG
ncbi:MAG: AMP-binding protein [Deltaproteobacteria bacterium]|nr:AMP-binding protein [Deltaproteobacteria bacterium]